MLSRSMFLAGLIGTTLLGSAVLTGCSSSHPAPAPSGTAKPPSGQNLLPSGAAAPMGISGVLFAPSGLGASLSIPSTWTKAGPASGFQYSARNSKSPFDFVLAGSHARLASNVNALARGRTSSLHRFDTTIQSVKTGTADGRPAVEFRYLIRVGQLTAQDLEYDIVSGDQVVLIVIGTPPASPDPSLVNWMASTIRVANS